MEETLPSGDFGEVLKDGVVLCKLMNKLQPGSIKKFKEKVCIVCLCQSRRGLSVFFFFVT